MHKSIHYLFGFSKLVPIFLVSFVAINNLHYLFGYSLLVPILSSITCVQWKLKNEDNVNVSYIHSSDNRR